MFEPQRHPHDGPILAAWGGHYDRVFIALHPFVRNEDAPWLGPVSWSNLGRALGRPPFSDFALAVTLAANGMDGCERSDADRGLIARLTGLVSLRGLAYPEDSVHPDALRPQVCGIMERLGSSYFLVWDEHRPEYRRHPVEVLREPLGSGALLTPVGLRNRPSGLADVDGRFVMTTFPMDNYYSVVGITADALDRLGGGLGLEGFWAGPETTFGWINEPDTYTYPDWLREAPHAA